MHENNLINRIGLIFESLKSRQIIDFLNQWNIDKVKLLSLVVESKIGYDLLANDPECKIFIDDIEESSVYNISEYSQLIMYISNMGDANTRFNSEGCILNKFQAFHKMLYKTGSLVLKLVAENSRDAEQQQNNIIENPLIDRATQAANASVKNAATSKVVNIDFLKANNTQAQKHAAGNQPDIQRWIRQDQPVSPQFQQNNSHKVSAADIAALQNQQNHLENVEEKVQSDEAPVTHHHDTNNIPEEVITLNHFLNSLAKINVPAE